MRGIPSLGPRRRDRSRAFILTAVAAGCLALFLLLLGWTMVREVEAVHIAAKREVKVAELRGRINYLDEVLTLSARLAAMGSEPLWIGRFEEAAPQLDAAIASAADMASPAARATLAATMLESHRDLMQMQRRALTLAADKRFEEARALLDGAEFGYLQDVYETGMEVFGADLRGSTEARASRLNKRTWMEALGFGAAAILLVVAVMTAQQRIRLRAAANTDVVTMLPNRPHFYRQLAGALGQGPAPGADRLVLLLIGIDHFKMINDLHGHARADLLLQLVADRLRTAVPPGRPLARVGGDEFALVVEAEPPRDAGSCAARAIMARLASPYRLGDGTEATLGFSAGAVWFKAGSLDGSEVMRQAGAALQQAKADGGSCLRVFDRAMDERARARDLLEADLRKAILGHEIVPFFQPLVDLRSGAVIGVETLARWRHATRGWVPPVEFIPLAEDLGLIGDLTQSLLRQACADAASWPAAVTVAVNISPLQLRDDALPAQIGAILTETGFPACRLEIEVTESALVQDLHLARALLEDLRGRGIRLALDDFGTGYSSLKHLRCLPFDKLKIDASFVGGMVDDPESGKIVAAVVGLGHSLGLSTVAEGVETRQVADLLHDLGCDIGQGWLYGRPMPAAEMAGVLGRTSEATCAA